MSQFFKQMVERDPLKYPSNMGKKWSSTETLKLLLSVEKKIPIAEIAVDHQRTIGGISSMLNKLATDYHFKDNMPIDEISKLTGLSIPDIEKLINKRSLVKNPEEHISPNNENNMQEVIFLLKDIQSKLSILIQKTDKSKMD